MSEDCSKLMCVLATIVFLMHHGNTLEMAVKDLSVFDSPDYLTKTYITELHDLEYLWKIRRSISKDLVPLIHRFKHIYVENSISEYSNTNSLLINGIFMIRRNLQAFKSSQTHLHQYVVSKIIETIKKRENFAITSKLHTIESPHTIFDGAVYGMVLIQDIDQSNVDTFKSNQIIHEQIRTQDRNTQCAISATDLLMFAFKAIELNWYSNAKAFINHKKVQTVFDLILNEYTILNEIQNIIANVTEYLNRQLSSSDSEKLKIDNLKYLPFTAKNSKCIYNYN